MIVEDEGVRKQSKVTSVTTSKIEHFTDLKVEAHDSVMSSGSEEQDHKPVAVKHADCLHELPRTLLSLFP